MLTKLVRIQVTVFAVIAVLGIGYVGAQYAGLDQLVGGSGYVVKARLADSGGIFTNAEVTYRGVPIGRVGELHLVADGVEVDMRIDSDAPRVPKNVEAVVANRSAAGEQYIDLRPRRSGGPYLAAGSVIAQRDTRTPLAVEDVLVNLDELVASVPKDDLKVVVDELYDATEGNAPALQSLLDTSAKFTREAAAHLPQTKRLINDAAPVLDTQLAMSSAIRDFGRNAKLIAGEMGRADGDLRKLLTATPSAARQVTALIQETGGSLSRLMVKLLVTSRVLLGEQEGVDRMLRVTPQAVEAARRVLSGDGATFGLITRFFEPPVCTRGYEGTRYRNGLDTSSAPFNTNANCLR